MFTTAATSTTIAPSRFVQPCGSALRAESCPQCHSPGREYAAATNGCLKLDCSQRYLGERLLLLGAVETAKVTMNGSFVNEMATPSNWIREPGIKDPAI